MAGGTWTPGANPGRPGLYLNFVEAANNTIVAGALGAVAMPYTKTLGGTATVGKFYTVDNEAQAVALFGVGNVSAILYALRGGAREVLVYTMATSPTLATFTAAWAKFDTQFFDVFVFDQIVTDEIQDAGLDWVQASRATGRYFHIVFGCSNASDDSTPANGVTRSVRLKDDFAINLVTGAVDGVTVLNSAQVAPYIAGRVASTPLSASTTYSVTDFTDVSVRLTNTEIKAALAGGCLVLVNDGEKVKIERGLCTSVGKIKRTRIQRAVVMDVSRTAENAYIGKIINNADGQIALISAIRAYMETLAGEGVIDPASISVKLSSAYPSTGDQVYIDMAFRDLDSVEEIYLSVQIA